MSDDLGTNPPFPIHLTWWEFSVNLSMVDAWMRTNAGDHYIGNSAEQDLTLWFSEQPTNAQISYIGDYWSSLTAESEEAVTYISRTQIYDRIRELRAGLVAKAWDEMSLAEKKIVVGETPTLSELGF